MAANNSSNSSLFPVDATCLFDKSVYDKYCLIPALIIITILSILNKRVKLKPNVCNGRPGLVLPINFLGDNTSNRLSIAIAFGVIANSCFQLFNAIVGIYRPSLTVVQLHNNPWEKAVTSVVWVLLYGITNFPILACLTTEHQLVGMVLGLCYTTMRFIAIMIQVFTCPSPYLQMIQKAELNPIFKKSVLLELLPELFCYLFLLIRISMLLSKELHRKFWKSHVTYIETPTPTIAKRHDFFHVRLLLRNRLTESVDVSRNWCIKLRNWFYKPRQDFKFSTEVVCTLTVSVIFIYQMTISLIIAGAMLTNLLQKLRKVEPKSSYYKYLMSLLDIFTEVLAVSVTVSACFSAIFSAFMILHFMKCHRGHVLFSFKTKKYCGNSPSRLVGRSLSYPGYQIAYIGFGYFILAVIVEIISICIGCITKLHLWSTLFHWFVKNPLPFLVVISSLWVFQFLLGWLVFRDRQFPDTTINVNNHRFYCVMSFFFFLLNILVGYWSSLLRLLKSFILGVVFLSRIDRTPLMMGFHKWDRGYMSYIGFLNVLKSFSHPVMLVFCQLLIDRCQSRRGGRALESEIFIGDTMNQQVIVHDSEEQECQLSRPVSKAAYNRWLVAYTLLKNPDLQQFRKRFLRVSFLTETEASGDVSSRPLVIN